ncbi:hypothetical protein [Micromonospora cathayae]|uniref:Uncharacterized protein n=1 Tax=Micromonospora cathayae TaxID=3028804 RepID=A0ABY7ZUA0_9ACTN|nr:hypothetical protein [Micromonospora sp. HUAS 3]WDZ86073.1 hypothetical protein PVK37_06505 [Micromonospora sp. HUAS 3]
MAMLNRTIARQPRLTRVSYAVVLLVLLGTATALAVVTRAPAHSSVQRAVPAAPADVPAGPSAFPAAGPSGPTGPPAGSGDQVGALADAGHRVPGRGGGTGRQDGSDTSRTAALHRSLVWSGLLGLAISLTGLIIVGSRRRMW